MLDYLGKNENVLVYGARMVAKEVGNVVSTEPFEANILAFVVSDKANNPSSLLGKPVITLDEAQRYYPLDTKVVVACLERYVDEIVESLDNVGFRNQVVLSFESDLWADVREEYFKKRCLINGDSFIFFNDDITAINVLSKDKLSVFCAHSHFDRILCENLSQFDWEIPIQVGTTLAGKSICECKDNTGINISQKNGEYCELTGLYWIWKNYEAAYKGLSHYRRHFCLSKECIDLIDDSVVDVIVTVPILNYPSVKAVYEHDHVADDWNIMMRAIEEIYPEYYESALYVQDGIYYFAYNMFIAKEKIFNKYCEWLFSILEYCELNCSAKEDKYQKRFLGFLSERLLTIFLIYHKDEYKIAISKKHFVER